jgi:ribosomal protein S20
MNTEKVFCNSCKKETNHERIFSKVIHDEILPTDEFPHYYNYWGTTNHILFQCLGCDNITYCQSFNDPGMFHEINEELVPYSTRTYHPPLSKVEFINSTLISTLPNKISNIYKEVKTAIENKLYTLAAAGLRAIIEGTYADKKLDKQRDLEKKIDNLFNEGLLTKNDASRLHSIRFLGNNAIHELDIPKENQIKIALNIVNHYLKSIYYPDAEVIKNLDIQISSYPDFISSITKHINEDMIGKTLSIQEMIPKINKLCKPDNLQKFKSILDNEIRDNRLRFLERKDGDKYKILIMNFFLKEDPYEDVFTPYIK